MTTLKVGIASYEEMKARTMAVARGERRVSANEPKVWFTSTEAFAKVLCAGNRELLRAIAEKTPGSLDELARITGKAKSNLSRTLRTMESYGLVRLERGKRGRITPKVMHNRVALELPLDETIKAEEPALDTEAYNAGFAAAMQTIRDFADRPAAAQPAAEKSVPRRRRAPARATDTSRPQRGTSARLIVEVLRDMPAGTAAPRGYPQGAAKRQGRVDGLSRDPPRAGAACRPQGGRRGRRQRDMALRRRGGRAVARCPGPLALLPVRPLEHRRRRGMACGQRGRLAAA
jgi:predicted transcriptional regulator